jgi:hypothetical protein
MTASGRTAEVAPTSFDRLNGGYEERFGSTAS